MPRPSDMTPVTNGAKKKNAPQSTDATAQSCASASHAGTLAVRA